MPSRPLVCIIAWAVGAIPANASLAQEEVPLNLCEGLVIGRTGTGGRVPFPTNALDALFAADAWTTPVEGAAVALPEGRSASWESIEADGEGWFRSPLLNGGSLWLPIESPVERVVLLETNGSFSAARVNGEVRTGDPYDTGWLQLPVLLRAGANELVFSVNRGALRCRLTDPASSYVLSDRDALLPQVIVGESEPLWGAMVVINATTSAKDDLVIVSRREDGRTVETPVGPMPPLSVKKAGFAVAGGALPEHASIRVTIELVDPTSAGMIVHGSREFTLPQVLPTQAHSRTFVSRIDGSVQYYAVQPASTPVTEGPSAPGLILTLHGASVEGASQRDQYAPRDWAHVIAPTNRRPYGFDWEDWGRLDAMEVLSLAAERFGVDRSRVWVTGHSMGGHGTWHLAVTFPGVFAAAGPSAGWVSFWSYTGAARYENADAVETILRRATNPSDTLALSSNLRDMGIYVLHGDADDNVPVEQARTMRTRLAEFHPSFAYHEQPGAGHWWGSACCDWPPMMDMFRRRSTPSTESARRIEFVTASPGVSATMHWATIVAQQRPLDFSRINLRFDPATRRLEGETENVSRLSIATPFIAEGSELVITLDGSEVAIATPSGGRRVLLERSDSGWSAAARWPTGDKNPSRYGPFKSAFDRDAILVYGTCGDDRENAWGLSKARLDAETFWYRGNGSFDVIADIAFDPDAEPNRNVILYGNAETNAAWSALLSDSPVQFERGRVRVGDRTLEGDSFGGLFIRPRPASDTASVGVVAGTGRHGMEITTRLPYFVSGVEYPDFVILDENMPLHGPDGVVAAGFFDTSWSLTPGLTAWRE
jgi:poly(3-hydroxybutyrate) depolymerase